MTTCDFFVAKRKRVCGKDAVRGTKRCTHHLDGTEVVRCEACGDSVLQVRIGAHAKKCNAARRAAAPCESWFSEDANGGSSDDEGPIRIVPKRTSPTVAEALALRARINEAYQHSFVEVTAYICVPPRLKFAPSDPRRVPV